VNIMSKYALFLSAFICFNCSSTQTEETTVTKDTVQTITKNSDTAVSQNISKNIDFTAPDTLQIAKLKWYAPTWDNTYFPLPTDTILKQYPSNDQGYLYLITSFDSLSSKIYTEYYEVRGEEENNASIPCAWKQSFKSGMTYSVSACDESGSDYTIHTSCPDKKSLVHLADIIFHDSRNTWNEDSSKYEPIDKEAGCYYSIEKNDVGNYDIKYYCGC
jgi:hypothetical protein